jgi:hypothetical protein
MKIIEILQIIVHGQISHAANAAKQEKRKKTQTL